MAPFLDVAPAERGALLQAIAHLERPVTRRQLAVVADVDPELASALIEEFIEAGIVHEVLGARSPTVELNRRHLAAGPILALAGMRGELISRLRARMGEWPDVVAAWLHGLMARGDVSGVTNIDLLIVVSDIESEDLRHRIEQLHVDVRDWTGNELNERDAFGGGVARDRPAPQSHHRSNSQRRHPAQRWL